MYLDIKEQNIYSKLHVLSIKIKTLSFLDGIFVNFMPKSDHKLVRNFDKLKKKKHILYEAY